MGAGRAWCPLSLVVSKHCWLRPRISSPKVQTCGTRWRVNAYRSGVGPMSFQVHHGRRRGSTRAVTAPAFPPDPRPSTAAAQPRETVATAHGGSRDEPLRRPAAFGGSSSVGSLNNQLRAMRATAPSRRSHRDVLLAPLPPLPPRPRLPPRGTLLDQLAQCQANADSLISDMHSTFKSRYDRTGLLLLLPARHLHVGRCAAS